VLVAWLCFALQAAETVEHPFRGITYIERVETAPRAVRMPRWLWVKQWKAMTAKRKSQARQYAH